VASCERRGATEGKKRRAGANRALLKASAQEAGYIIPPGPETLTYDDIARVVAKVVAGDRVFATWEEAELMEVPMTTSSGTVDAGRLGVVPKPMRAVLGPG